MIDSWSSCGGYVSISIQVWWEERNEKNSCVEWRIEKLNHEVSSDKVVCVCTWIYMFMYSLDFELENK
jgi:hypothetical protein